MPNVLTTFPSATICKTARTFKGANSVSYENLKFVCICPSDMAAKCVIDKASLLKSIVLVVVEVPVVVVPEVVVVVVVEDIVAVEVVVVVVGKTPSVATSITLVDSCPGIHI